MKGGERDRTLNATIHQVQATILRNDFSYFLSKNDKHSLVASIRIYYFSPFCDHCKLTDTGLLVRHNKTCEHVTLGLRK